MAIYEKVYEKDDYKEQFEALRNRYHDRTQEALSGRKIDKAPVPNATTVVFLHDDGNGNTEITTGDFVAFFNHRFGDSDRLGAMRRSLACARSKAEQSREYQKRQRLAKKREMGAHRFRSTGRRLVMLNSFFALMLVLSLALIVGSTALLRRADERVEHLSGEVTALRNAENLSGNTAQFDALGDGDDYLEFDGEDSVQVYDDEEKGRGSGTLAGAFATLFGTK